MFHVHGRHAGGPRGGSFRRGPLSVEWSVERDGRGLGRGGRGRRRMFDGDELKLLLVALIAEQPRHGYDLIREIEERSGGAYAPSPGVVYPTLTLLDEMALIEEVKEEGARRRFAITEAGSTWLEEKRATADALLARLAELGKQSEQTDRGPIRRAMGGLHLAVREAVSGKSGDEAHQIAEILDEATRRIERL